MAKRIMSLQEQDTTREKYATDIIINDGDNENLFNQVKELYSNLLNG
jgi:dephospho-CoA kinase